MRIGKLRQGCNRDTPDPTHSGLQRTWQIGKELVDLAAKLAAPAAVIAAAILAQNFQASSHVSQLLHQREESDTKIRAEMFKAITDRLFQRGGQKLTLVEQAVFTELLALNFHEHIELKPLMLDIDSAFAKRVKAGTPSPSEQTSLTNRRHELWSTARRMRLRQTALLTAIPTDPIETVPDGYGSIVRTLIPFARAADLPDSPVHGVSDGRLEFIGVRFAGKRLSQDEKGNLGCDVEPTQGRNICSNELVTLGAPQSGSRIALSVEKADWDNQRFDVSLKLDPGPDHELPPGGEPVKICGKSVASGMDAKSPVISGQSRVLFQATWFDLPLTDNTLLASGDRFAVFIDEVCDRPKASEQAMRLGVLWFPRDYFPARERPTNYRQVREKLGLNEVRDPARRTEHSR